LRPSEILALQHKHVSEGCRSITIEQRLYRGDIDDPKTTSFKREVGIPPETAAILRTMGLEPATSSLGRLILKRMAPTGMHTDQAK
jgi:hypothetical protein